MRPLAESTRYDDCFPYFLIFFKRFVSFDCVVVFLYLFQFISNSTKLFPRVLLWLIMKFIVPSYLRFYPMLFVTVLKYFESSLKFYSESYQKLLRTIITSHFLSQESVSRLEMPIFFFWLQQALMNPKVWNPKVFWKVMTIKAATSRTMRHQFVSHRLPVNFQMRMSALNQNVSIHFYLQFNNTMTSDTFSYLRCLRITLYFLK